MHDLLSHDKSLTQPAWRRAAPNKERTFPSQITALCASRPCRLSRKLRTANSASPHAYTLREPVGVVGQIVPWNFPFVMGVAKIAPALAVGCTVVLKPAEQTPLTTLRLGELIAEAGFPEGVVNIVTGFGETAGRALVAHADVNKIAFTGSTSVGKEILKACAGNLKRVTLELGGKSPVIIFPDAALEPATEVAARGIFMNSGQVCAAGSRLFVHEKVFEQVVEGVVARARKLNLGPGTEASTEIGPVVSEVQRKRVMGYIESGRGDGAKVLVGGTAPARAGYLRGTHGARPTPRATCAWCARKSSARCCAP